MKKLYHFTKQLPVNICKGFGYAGLYYRRFQLIIMLMLFNQLAMAQGTVGGITQMQSTIVQIVNIVFIIVIVLGLIRVIIKVVKSEPDWAGSVVGLLIALVLWGGFNTYKNEIFAWFGGGQILNPGN